MDTTTGRSAEYAEIEREVVMKKKGKTLTQKDVPKILETLNKYVSGKYSIDSKAIENQQWWRQRHADIAPDSAEKLYESQSAWAINSILNKHADIMDSFPKPNILPREADDEPEAEILTDIIPVALERNDYEQVYRQMAWDFCIDGACITGVFWDNNKNDGLGDIAVTNIDVHNLFWQPGVNDIEESERVFFLSLEDADKAKLMYPEIADKIGPQDTGKLMKYIHDDNVDTSNCVEVINMYYKKTVGLPVYADGTDADGNPIKVQIHTVPKTYLHLAIIVGDQLVFCSENDPAYAQGYYKHGKYPFVIRRAFPIKDTPWGFGYLDIMKAPQMYIDAMDDDIMRITDMKARPRFWVRKNGDISKEQFADWNEPFIEVGTGDLGASVRQVEISDVPAGIMQHKMNKIDELKETSGNRDFSQGSTQSGVTAASAIAALQEAGSKLSRDINKELYRGSREEYYLVIELIRQFYTEARPFRVTSGQLDRQKYIMYSNANITEDAILPDGTIRHTKPIFDIQVTAEKQSPFNRAAQNETIKELYGMGLFAPENSVAALVCIDAMDFEGKDKIRQQIQENSIFLQQFQAAMGIIQQMAMIDPAVAQMAMQAGLIAPEQMPQPQMQTPSQESNGGGTPEERAARHINGGDNSQAAKMRARVANAAAPR